MSRSRQQALYGAQAVPVPAPGPPALARPRAEVALQLRERIKLGKELEQSFPMTVGSSPTRDPPTYKEDAIKWSEFNSTFLNTAFTTDAIAREYDAAAFGMSLNSGDTGTLKLFAEGVEQQIQKLESIVERLDLYAEPPAVVVEARAAMPIEHREQKVFVVHGHDEGAREGVARFLEKIGLKAIILREQPNRGRTIIEKFVDYAREVGFAVVLLTPDDLGGTTATEVQLSRARQNVIFELGYFVGSLGRGRACLLRKGEVEIPSDLYGVVYTDMDSADGWKIALARELKDAGFEFDASKALA
jgi:predicted nucleotide-binding protein